LTDSPLLPGGADPTGFSIFVSVPALDRLGLLLLALLTLTLAAWRIRTR
jgi:hypothetical protein